MRCDWLVKLPVSVELRDGEGVPFAVRGQLLRWHAVCRSAAGRAGPGLVTRTEELRLVDEKLSAGYVAGRTFVDPRLQPPDDRRHSRPVRHDVLGAS